MKKHRSTFLLVFVFLIGLSLLLYPTVSDYWNSRHQSYMVATYVEDVGGLDDNTYQEILDAAHAYNKALAKSRFHLILSEKERADYQAQLDVSGNGIMGYIEIEKLGCSLPIYHGTDEGVLRVGIGHIEGSSLPVGGENTHCILSGHRGMPNAKLFTNLDQMKEGDTFILRVLDETLTYEVDQILTVEPNDVSSLAIEKGKDYCTLVTCTPYGINSQRLLVRGHRVENARQEEDSHVSEDVPQKEPISWILPTDVLIACLLLFLFLKKRSKGEGGNTEASE